MIKGWLAQGDLATARKVLDESRRALERLGKANAAKARAARKAITGMKGKGRLERAEKKAGRGKQGEGKEKAKNVGEK